MTEECIKKAEFDFMLGLKSIIEKTATDPELIKVRLCVRRRNKNQAPHDFKHGFEKISDRWGILFSDDRIIIPSELRPKLLQTLHHGHAGSTKMLADAKIFWWPGISKAIERTSSNCVACMSSGKNLKYQLPEKSFGKLTELTEPGQEIQIDFSGKLHNRKISGEPYLLIAIDRFSKWPTAKICKSTENKEVIKFLENHFNLHGLPEKIKSDRGGAFISQEYKNFCKGRNIEIEYCPPKIHTGNGTIERAIQTIKNLVITNLEDTEFIGKLK